MKTNFASIPSSQLSDKHDISKRTYEELCEENKLLYSTLQQAKCYQAVVKTIYEGKRINGFELVLAVSPGPDYPGETLSCHHFPDFSSLVNTALLDEYIRLAETGIPFSKCEMFIVGGIERHFRLQATPLPFENYFLWSWEDITDAKEKDQELKRTIDQLNAIFESAQVQLSYQRAIRNKKGEIIDFDTVIAGKENQHAAIHASEAVRQCLHGGSPYVKNTEMWNFLVKAIETGNPQRFKSLRHDTGSTFSADISCIKYEDGVICATLDITGKKEGESKMDEYVHIIEKITEISPDLISLFELPQHRLLYANRHMLMKLPNQLVRKDAVNTLSDEFTFLTHPEDQKILEAYRNNIALATDSSVIEIEYRAMGNDGQWKWLKSRSKVFKRDAMGRPQQYFSVTHDITNEKKAEESIKEQNYFIEQVNNMTPDIIYVLDVNELKLVYANNRVSTVLGADPVELYYMGKSIFDAVLHPDDHLGRLENIEASKLLKDGEMQSFQCRIKTKDGDWHWVELRERVFKRDASGNVVQTIGLVHDIQERREAEELMSKTKELLELTFRTSILGKSVLNSIRDSSGTIVDFYYALCNPQAIKYAGFELERKNYLDLYPEAKEDGMLDKLIAVVEGQAHLDMHQHTVVAGNERWYRIMGVKLGDGIMMTQEDITVQKKAEDEVIKLKISQQKEITNAILKAQETERVRIGEALHDGLGQLLYGIKLKSETYFHNIYKNEKAFREIDTLLKEAIEATRNMSFELIPIALKEGGLEDALTTMFSRIINPQLHIGFSTEGFSERLPECLEVGIYRIVQELMNNVVKHAKAEDVKVKLILHAGRIKIKVEDNGVGFDESKLTALNKGIGLQSIRNRVSLLYGTMNISSSTDKGTTIRISIPV